AGAHAAPAAGPRLDARKRARAPRAGAPLPAAPLRGSPHARRILHGHAEGLPGLVGPARSEIEKRDGIRRLTLDEDRVAAVRQLDRPWRAFPITRPHPPGPSLRAHLEGAITGHEGRVGPSAHSAFSPRAT